MTGYQSKKAAAQDKLAQEPLNATREAFEEWAKSRPHYMDITRFENGYSDCNTDYAWAGWQAAQPAQEHVATVQCIHGITIGYLEIMQPVGTKLYTAPPQRTWVGLTSKDLNEIFEFAMTGEGAVHRAVAKFKEKNNG
jgi:hypothetical protein